MYKILNKIFAHLKYIGGWFYLKKKKTLYINPICSPFLLNTSPAKSLPLMQMTKRNIKLLQTSLSWEAEVMAEPGLVCTTTRLQLRSSTPRLPQTIWIAVTSRDRTCPLAVTTSLLAVQTPGIACMHFPWGIKILLNEDPRLQTCSSMS